jgi:hypothetical protein
MPGNLYKRPMFRKGGSAEGGITSGLSTPKRGIVDGPGSYAGVDMNLNVEQALKNASLGDLKTMADQMYSSNVGTARPKRRFNDFLIDFGLDIASRPAEGNIFQTAAMSAKDPFKRFQDARSQEELLMETQNEKLEDRRSDMFKSLIEGQSDILAEKSGSGRFRDEAAAIELRRIIPRLTELKEKRKNETLGQGEDVELLQLQEEFNLYRKKDVGQELLVDIYVKGKGERYLPNKMEEIYKEDLKLQENRKYKNNTDPQIERDAIDAIRKEIQELTSSFASGGRAGYANGEIVKEQVTETETMDQGPMAQSDNPISYDQLRARLPNQITDDIVELMANSAEALEDFAMISSQQDVDLFNQKYSVNLVLPSEA